jgi:CheY-like chemotaxis protein
MCVRHKDALIDTITTLLPALIIVEINHPSHVWHNFLALLKSDPATRRIPILVYGLHIQAEKLSLAAELGMDVALPGSKFIKQLSLIIKHHANIQDENVMLVCCQANLSEHAHVGIERFNQEEYFFAHEYFEQAWIDDNSPGRDLCSALFQAAAVCYQIEWGNYIDARKMFLRLRQWLAWVPDQCRGIDIDNYARKSIASKRLS